MHQSDSMSWVKIKKKALERVNPEQDTCRDDVTAIKKYTLEGNPFKYEHSRPLPPDIAQKAIAYIRAMVKKYPFQLRYVLALPYWKRFSETWCDTGDEEKSLRSI